MMTIEEQEQKLKKSLFDVLEYSTEENKQNYLQQLNVLEFLIIQEANKYNHKTPEYFAIKKEAFSIRRKSAMELINLWIKKYGNLENCPMKYVDTLNIPFQAIKEPK